MENHKGIPNTVGVFGPMGTLPADAPRDEKVAHAKAYALHHAFKNGFIGLAVGVVADQVLIRQWVRYQKYLGVGPRTFLVSSCGVAAFWVTQETCMLEYMAEQGHIDVAGRKGDVKRATDW